jgi:hypothetical protein
MPNRHDDDDDDDTPPGAWVLASWHCYHSLSVNFVVKVDGKPRPDWHSTSARHEAYRWNSYHAARKFQKAHRKLRGYIILNLSVIEQQAEQQRQDYEEWIYRDREPAPPVPVKGRAK